MPIEVTIEMPFDWIGGILLPAITILVSAGIAIWVASFERKRAEKEAMRAQATRLIRALGTLARSYARRDAPAMNESNLLFEQELNAFGAHLSRRDVPVAKFVAIVSTAADEGDTDLMPRTAMWLVTALELWLRGDLKSRDFAVNMPADTTTWSEHIDLGDHFAVVKGEPAVGIPDTLPYSRRDVSPR